MRTVHVPIGDRSYDVIIGDHVLDDINRHIPEDANRVAIVTQANIPVELNITKPAKQFVVPYGEGAKSFHALEHLLRGFAQYGMSRRDVIIGLGGGVVTDLAGFAASIYHRGTRFLAASTTLLGQVDASVGGKTAINIPEGKNLVGSFWQPLAVLCDTATLRTLPPREMKSGYGELAKYHFLGSRVDLDTAGLHKMSLEDQVATCIELKARVVAADERESRFRYILNYGHTLAHAIEISESFDVRHGEAVAIGMYFASRLARRLGRIDDARVQYHLDVLNAYGLDATLPPHCNPVQLIELMNRDKKNHGGLTFVLDGPNGVDVVDNIDESIVKKELMS